MSASEQTVRRDFRYARPTQGGGLVSVVSSLLGGSFLKMLSNDNQGGRGAEAGGDYDADSFDRAVSHEKNCIIYPALKPVFERACANGSFQRGKDRVLDFGCGTFTLARPFLEDGIAVDGVEPSPAMRDVAFSTLMGTQTQLDRSQIRIVGEPGDLNKGAYALTMMNFVHQCCGDERALRSIFKSAANLTKPGGTLILVATHPDYMHVPHSSYEFAVPHSSELKDKDVCRGVIFDGNGSPTFHLEDDVYWTLDSVKKAARHSGFIEVERKDIDDVASRGRPASDEPAYAMMVFERRSQNTVQPF